MSWHLWLGFAAASALIAVVPGPGVMSIVGYAIGAGRRVALAAVAGLAVGNTIAITLSLAGVGVLLAGSAAAFAVLKWVGALYLIGLGVATLLRGGPVGAGPEPDRPAIAPRTAFLGNVLVGTFHPKTIVFFVAFAPQFIDPAGDYVRQAAILVVTFTLVVGCGDTLYALAAARAGHLRRGPRAARWSRRAGGGVLIASGLATAAARR